MCFKNSWNKSSALVSSSGFAFMRHLLVVTIVLEAYFHNDTVSTLNVAWRGKRGRSQSRIVSSPTPSTPDGHRGLVLLPSD
jgi:hypothetical protein